MDINRGLAQENFNRDYQIEHLLECKPSPESEAKSLCDKVHSEFKNIHYSIYRQEQLSLKNQMSIPLKLP